MGVLTFAAASWLLRQTYQRLERRGIFDIDQDAASRPTAWIDGLRGISALGVVSTHLSTCLAMWLFKACCAPGSDSPSIFQLPPLKLLASGPAWLSTFFILSGLASSLEPLRLARSGRLGDAYTHIGRSALRRPLRFVLPASAATTASWLVCQLGGYVPARHVGVLLLTVTSPRPAPGLLAKVGALFRALTNTWTWLGSDNEFEQTQDALVAMLFGSYLVYGVLLTTLGMKPAARVAAVGLVLYLSFDWSWRLVDQTCLPFLCGVLLAELWHSEYRKRLERVGAVLSPVLVFLGIIFMSWPKADADKVWWTFAIQTAVVDNLPRVRDAERLVGPLGSSMLVGAVMFSLRLRKSLSKHLVLWLGKISFAIYLLHMMVIRLAAPWLLYVSNPFSYLAHLRDMDSQEAKSFVSSPGPIRGVLGVTMLLLLILAAAQTWTVRFEPKIEKVAHLLESSVSAHDPPRERSVYKEGRNGQLPVYNKSKPR